jgi:membrane associated rhomboid family serine protease
VLIIVNVAVFVLMFLSDIGVIQSSFIASIGPNFALYPYYVVRGEQLYTFFTSMFIHADWFHLIGNMLFLYVFGHARYFLFYIVSGLAASATYLLTLPGISPLEAVVGASGAISGVLGAYLVLFPKARILTLIFFGWVILLPIPAVIFLGIWFGLQWFSAFFEIGSNIAFWAHIGGFVVGMIIALAFGLALKKKREKRYRY